MAGDGPGGGAPLEALAQQQQQSPPPAQQQQQEGKEPKVAVITTLGCKYCKATKAALQGAGIAFTEYDLGQQLEVLSQVKSATGQSTVPQVFVGGRLLGGASDVVPLAESGQLAALLAASQAPPLPAELQALLPRAAAAAKAAQQQAEAAEGDPQCAQHRALAAAMRAALGSPGRTFALSAAADWLSKSQGVPTDGAAAALAQLQSAQLLTLPDAPATAVSQRLLATQPRAAALLVADAPAPTQWSQPLNGRFEWFGGARPAAEVAASLRGSILNLYDKHLTDGGKKVDYARLKADPAWQEFVTATAELQKVDLAQLASREERMAFFINIYNALVVHALVVFCPGEGTLGRLRWFDNISYLIGGTRWSSNDVEHGVLRGNAPSPASLFSLLGKPQWAGRTFKAGDQRAALAIQPVDPRIHFALNCGAASCPPIKLYSPETLEFGLDAAARAFCASEVQVDGAAGELELSMILKWYGPDFGSRRQLLDFLAEHLPEGPAGELRQLLATRPPVLALARPSKATKPASKAEVQLNSTLAPMVVLAGINPLANFLQGQADYFSTLGLPQWLVQWGHPGNMAVVLVAMGCYGSGYLGWRIRLSDDAGEVATAQDLHPKLAIGMTAFFALGALGGSMSTLMQGKDLWSSSHFTTGIIGLVLLGLQGMLSAFFDDDPNARGLHAYFGTAILALFVIHAALGLQLGLSLSA
ncbi:hypothetical protein C2E20_3010 [Micractinium conductrix]|uniref:Uncharacterized protein n=1 Tax=Micractinium conductrix TaxID=554055 RepID=A0A2P6VIB9_9CHLO|nr:hypothetical protein C2E20_3010 [Micractinium conductrix]|eukprot:PSC73843.1 hypothetical protein C2E20_3010 [Micractinium conductrix]